MIVARGAHKGGHRCFALTHVVRLCASAARRRTHVLRLRRIDRRCRRAASTRTAVQRHRDAQCTASSLTGASWRCDDATWGAAVAAESSKDTSSVAGTRGAPQARWPAHGRRRRRPAPSGSGQAAAHLPRHANSRAHLCAADAVSCLACDQCGMRAPPTSIAHAAACVRVELGLPPAAEYELYA